jgi:hypothetical protein
MDRYDKTEVEILDELRNQRSRPTRILAYLMEHRRWVFRVGKRFWGGTSNRRNDPIHPIFTGQEP